MRIILVLALAMLVSCSLIDASSRNPILVDIATRQAVYRYIDAAETEQGKIERAGDVVQRLRNVDAFLQGNPTSSISTLLDVLESQIEWDSLSRADRILVQDIVSLVKLNLEQKAKEEMLDQNAVIGLRNIINIAISTASML